PQPSPPQKTPDPTVATANPQPVEPPPALVGHLQINVNATDANIRLDGQPVGTASPGNPLNLEGLQLGPHRIEVEAAGYQPLRQPIQVEAQQWTQLAIQLKPVITTGELIIRSNVSGDTVYIDGKAVGPTGKTPHRLAAGEHTVRVEKPGYESWEQSAQIKAGEQQTLRVELQPKSGELAISVDPAGATVRIDGQSVGGAGTYKLRAGTHRVRIEKTGYKPYETQATVTPGQQETLRAQLAANRQPYEPEMVALPGGSFEMGSPSSEEGRDDDEQQHRVSVSRFKLAKTEVTQAQWQAVMGNNPSSFKGCATCPVEQVSWQDVQSYISKLNQRTGKRYRLPTEAEWEYACRGGRAGERYCGGDNVDRLAWYGNNSGDKTHPVGQKQPNGFGLYDMSGNVWEWTCSEYDQGYGGGEQRCVRQNSDAKRSIRGGSWFNKPRWVRSANRHGFRPSVRDFNLGFRLAQD
ncbi:MAG: SUMF1/EgtB/PvdO family nonheme iron enzyme, partial [Candidatus Thiodiazotropha taylori]